MAEPVYMTNDISTQTEILINASQVTHHDYGDAYEFVLDIKLDIVECARIESLLHGIITPIPNPSENLQGYLFELNHVRVNPNVNNTVIINKLTETLENLGVSVNNRPHHESMQVAYKPLGEISDNIRFYINPENHLIFLCTTFKPKVLSGGLTSSPSKLENLNSNSNSNSNPILSSPDSDLPTPRSPSPRKRP